VLTCGGCWKGFPTSSACRDLDEIVVGLDDLAFGLFPPAGRWSSLVDWKGFVADGRWLALH